MAVSTHWFACIIALQASLHTHIEQTWAGDRAYGLCPQSVVNASAAVSLADGHEPGPVEGCEHMSLGSWYLAACTWAALVITGTGGTDYYPSATSDPETFIVLILVFCGAFLWTYVLAAFCDGERGPAPRAKLARFDAQSPLP